MWRYSLLKIHYFPLFSAEKGLQLKRMKHMHLIIQIKEKNSPKKYNLALFPEYVDKSSRKNMEEYHWLIWKIKKIICNMTMLVADMNMEEKQDHAIITHSVLAFDTIFYPFLHWRCAWISSRNAPIVIFILFFNCVQFSRRSKCCSLLCIWNHQWLYILINFSPHNLIVWTIWCMGWHRRDNPPVFIYSKAPVPWLSTATEKVYEAIYKWNFWRETLASWDCTALKWLAAALCN